MSEAELRVVYRDRAFATEVAVTSATSLVEACRELLSLLPINLRVALYEAMQTPQW